MRALFVLLLAFTAEDAIAQVFTPTRAPASDGASHALRAELGEAREALRVERETEAIAQSEASRRRATRGAEAAEAAARIGTLEANVSRLERQVDERADRVRLLTQGALDGLVQNDAPAISIQAADLFFTDVFRVYLRSTLSVDPPEEDDTKSGEEGGDEEAPDPAVALAARVSSALLDPYGGLLYLTTGALTHIAGPRLPAGRTPRGLFLDVRGGVKAVQLNEGTGADRTPIVPFATWSAGVTFQWPVWNGAAETPDDDKAVGDVVFGLTWAGNAVLDANASDLFTGDAPTLDEWTHTLALSAGISLKGVAKLTFTGNPWSSNASLGKRFAVGLTVVR